MGECDAELVADILAGPGVARPFRRHTGHVVVLYAADRLFVDAHRVDDGSLVIRGQDLSGRAPGGGEYEYSITVAPEQVPVIVRALGGRGDADVLELLERSGPDIIHNGRNRLAERHRGHLQLLVPNR